MRRAAGQGCGAGAGTAKARTRASHRSCGRVSHTMVRARALAYAISVRGRGAARDVGAQHVLSRAAAGSGEAGGAAAAAARAGLAASRPRFWNVPRRSALVSVHSRDHVL